MHIRQYSFSDQLCIQLNRRLQTWFGRPSEATRPSPSETVDERPLSSAQKRYSAGLMRINHTGEVCAQALYEGQALMSRTPEIRQTLSHAAAEEVDHLAWCFDRLQDLDSRTSYLNPIWYAGSFSFGILAGVLGDAWSLGFLAETEKQVTAHLEKHLKTLPSNDQKSRAVLNQMKIEEEAHATVAAQKGAVELPSGIKKAMRGMSWVMTKFTYWI